MRGLILAAGFGTRMRPLTEHLPKALVPVCGEPLLGRTLQLFSRHDWGPLAVNSHYLHDHIAAYAVVSPVPFTISHEEERILGTGGAIYHARDFLLTTRTCFVCNAEPVKEPDLVEIETAFDASGAACGLVSVPVDTGGTIFGEPHTDDYLGTTDDDLSGRPLKSYCYIGIALYRREAIELVTEEDFSVVPLWRRVQEAGMRTVILATEPGMYWRDIGTPAELARVHFDVLSGASPYSVPAAMQFDDTRGSAWPRELPECLQSAVGRGVWLETADIPVGVSLERSVVLADSRLEPDRSYVDTLVTPHGEMAIG